MTLHGFADTGSLSEDVLRTRMREGDAQERVWCAWALGLRLGARVTPLVLDAARVDVDPGVRRHCIVMLAGAGELDLLATLAAHDPDAHVRATALQYVVRLLEDEPPALFSLVEERLRTDPAPEVKVAAILNLPLLVPHGVREAVQVLLLDGDASVRDAAVERLLAWNPASADVREHLGKEPLRFIRARILRAWANDEVDLLKAAASFAPPLRHEALAFLSDAGSQEARRQLAELAERSRPSQTGALALIPLRGRP